MKMNQKIKKRWIKKLNDPSMKQHKGKLRSVKGNSFCCLGVLCEVYREDHPETKWDKQNNKFLYQSDILPNEVINWAELDSCDPNIFVNSEWEFNSLSELNDKGTPFKEIAKLINKSL